MTRPYDALVRVAWAAGYAVVLVVAYAALDPLSSDRGGAALAVASVAAVVLVVAVARSGR